jgi:DNA modification methylase
MQRRALLSSTAQTSEYHFFHPKIEMWPLERLRPSKDNARTHPKKQRDKLIRIIRQCGFFNPILVDEQGKVISGHLRFSVAEQLGLTEIPVIQITHLSDLEKRALALAENRIALDAGWDREMLAAELGELAILLPEIALDLSITGFEIAETDLILGDHQAPVANVEEDQLPALRLAVSRLGETWRLDKHRLHCADARDQQAYDTVLAGEAATMVFTDPPYNVSVSKHARARSRVAFDEFAMASGEMSERQYQRFLERVLENIARVCIDGAIVDVCIDWRHLRQLLEAGDAVFSELKNIACWVKTNAGQGSFYRSQHELIAIFKKGNAPHRNSFELGQHGRSRTNVWNYAGVNTFKADRRSELDAHPTVKPMRLVADALLDCSGRGSVILDPFIGSGTTIIAGEVTGRRVYGLEIDARYVDVAIRRFQEFTGRDAVLETTGETFAEVEADRRQKTESAPQRATAKTRRGGRR